MKYLPRPDLEGINNSETHPLKDVVILVVGFLVVAGLLVFSLALAGEFFLGKLSLEREMKLFSSFEWFKDDQPKELNVLLLEDISTKLEPSVKFSIDVVCEESPNAFAFPGGKISLTSGLLEKVKTERGLAFVVAHEIGHVVNRHHLRGLGFQLGLAIGSAFLGLDSVGGVTGSLLSDVIGRKHSRAGEIEADAFALKAMKKAYGDIAGAEEFFEVAQKEMPEWVDKMPSWMSTHPGTSERLAVIRRLSSAPAAKAAAAAKPALEIHGITTVCK